MWLVKLCLFPAHCGSSFSVFDLALAQIYVGFLKSETACDVFFPELF